MGYYSKLHQGKDGAPTGERGEGNGGREVGFGQTTSPCMIWVAITSNIRLTSRNELYKVFFKSGFVFGVDVHTLTVVKPNAETYPACVRFIFCSNTRDSKNYDAFTSMNE